MDPRQSIIETAFEDRANINPANASAELKANVESVIKDLDTGTLRVARHPCIRHAVLKE